MKLIIRTRSELVTLSKFHRFSLMPRHESIILEFGELTKDEKTSWEKKLTRLYNDCGCSLGAVFLLCSLVSFAVHFILFPLWSILHILEYVLITVFSSVIASFAGKVLGILMGHIRFQKYSRLLLSHISVEKSLKTNSTFLNQSKEENLWK